MEPPRAAVEDKDGGQTDDIASAMLQWSHVSSRRNVERPRVASFPAASMEPPFITAERGATESR